MIAALGILMAAGGVLLLSASRHSVFSGWPKFLGCLWVLSGAILIVTGLVGS